MAHVFIVPLFLLYWFFSFFCIDCSFWCRTLISLMTFWLPFECILMVVSGFIIYISTYQNQLQIYTRLISVICRNVRNVIPIYLYSLSPPFFAGGIIIHITSVMLQTQQYIVIIILLSVIISLAHYNFIHHGLKNTLYIYYLYNHF